MEGSGDLSMNDWRELYDGLTREDPGFREAIEELGDPTQDAEMFSDLDRTRNRLNYAMLGVHPIYRREVELSGMIDHYHKELVLAGDDGDIIYTYGDLDPAYVAFLENQKRVDSSDDTTPLSSVALKTSHSLLKGEMDLPSLDGVSMNVSSDTDNFSREILEKAFVNSMVLMTHLKNEIRSRGLDQTYGMSKDHLLQYSVADSFNNSFERSVGELSELAKGAVNEYGM